MTTSAATRPAGLGFLTVVADDEQGLFGGYLVLNAVGRPLEFHCTAPIKPNRAQQILYGPTLAPYLYGEQIGQALVRKATTEVLLICTDAEPMLAVREFTSVPVALVEFTNDAPAREQEAASGVVRFGRHRLRTCRLHGRDDAAQLAARLEPLAEQFDLVEPFARIREALLEAKRAA
ncbi:MAG: hypothetical protein KF708_18305 [Pirellulales bacterium]|nr:hypothetical protein [Pirellulales bacterium]